jgi:hypothetical protein
MSRSFTRFLCGGVLIGYAASGALGFWIGRASGFGAGERAGQFAAELDRAKIDAEMREAHFCEWPKAFYAKINCGGLAPDYPRSP